MFLACAQRHTILLHRKDTWRHLADRLRLARIPGQRTPRSVIPAVSEYQDERDDNPYCRLLTPRGAAHTCSNRHAGDTFLLDGGDGANTTQALL